MRPAQAPPPPIDGNLDIAGRGNREVCLLEISFVFQLSEAINLPARRGIKLLTTHSAPPNICTNMAESFQHPLQCMQFVKKKNGDSRNVLVASAGAKLFSYAAGSGQRLSVWPQDGVDNPNADSAGSNPEIEGPPEKKRKVDPSAEHKAGVESTKKPAAWTNIPIVTSTSNGEYLVALTGEDKCVRVFQIEEDGSFLQLSERSV